VLSSRSEAFPRSVLEAMCAGLPVVASGVGGVAEAVDHGTSGLLVPRQNAPALAAALEGLIGDCALRQRMGVAARLSYETRFRLERMAGETAALYETVSTSNVRA
jgi:glycosyltransferase involved in cell wall biosynthesis